VNCRSYSNSYEVTVNKASCRSATSYKYSRILEHSIAIPFAQRSLFLPFLGINRTVYGDGANVMPGTSVQFSESWPSGGSISKLCTSPETNRKISCRASNSPRHDLLPAITAMQRIKTWSDNLQRFAFNSQHGSSVDNEYQILCTSKWVSYSARYDKSPNTLRTHNMKASAAVRTIHGVCIV
jgi:hypothetical protein